MPILSKQLDFCDISTDFEEFYFQNREDLLSLLGNFINIRDFIPFSFYQDYYARLGTKRDYSLESMLMPLSLKTSYLFRL